MHTSQGCQPTYHTADYLIAKLVRVLPRSVYVSVEVHHKGGDTFTMISFRDCYRPGKLIVADCETSQGILEFLVSNALSAEEFWQRASEIMASVRCF